MPYVRGRDRGTSTGRNSKQATEVTGSKYKVWDGAPEYVRLLKRVRQRHRWNQEQLAAALGCSLCTIKKWESGVRQPRVMVMFAIRSLDKDPEEEE